MNSSALLLERLGALIHQSVREDAARHGLLPIHVQVLGYLAQANRYSDLPIAIAEYFGITRGTVSQSLAVLERKGLLLKRPDPRHGRRIHLELTPAGRAVLDDSWTRRLDAALQAAAGEDGGRELETGLRRVLTELQRLNGQRAFGICRQCVHFQGAPANATCGLTGEPLAEEQTGRLCREWSQSAGQGS
ncbi:MAG TPA: MarR family winged helix-turn-helix transcriptional regulator [Thiohalobacter sp.]|nr:MarR family winged helix-turn-helix transcriptional regulator [Thiohalobacter sp.]